MKKVISTERRPIKLWLEDMEEGALAQAKNLANLPFIYKWVAIMPDSHQGYGMPIGGVIATEGVIIPNAVGVDIGCGMCALKLPITVDEITSHLKEIVGRIRETIPVGFSHHEEAQDDSWMPDREVREDWWVIPDQYESARKQVGTLGGGNHFIEIQADEDDNVWLMIHSGSRNLGYKVAKHYNDLAKKMNELWHTSIPKKHDLAFLPIGTKEAGKYIEEMKYCTEFAKCNREHMLAYVLDIFMDYFSNVSMEGLINIAHNYASLENHFGKNVWVHRKGATSAKEGELGIIPGSQGTKSYIVRGKGNKDSFMSCSHGAGRTMGRKQAQRELNLEDEQKRLDEQGILHSIRGVSDLDEAPSAYKDINIVMENQTDLVEIITELRPLAVVKV